MKYAMPASVAVLAVALLVAIPLGPWLAEWIVERPSGAMGNDAWWTLDRWTLGVWGLILAMVLCTILGALVVAGIWAIATAQAPPPPDPKKERRKKAQTLIEVVNRRRDLTPDEKDGFKDSAIALANADDPVSIRAADLVGEGDAVTAAKGLAKEAENELQRWLRHAVNLATPFSDGASKDIDKKRTHFAGIEQLVSDLDACQEARKACTKCCTAPAEKCSCGKEDCAVCKCDHGAEDCDSDSGEKPRHARVDVLWD